MFAFVRKTTPLAIIIALVCLAAAAYGAGMHIYWVREQLSVVSHPHPFETFYAGSVSTLTAGPCEMDNPNVDLKASGDGTFTADVKVSDKNYKRKHQWIIDLYFLSNDPHHKDELKFAELGIKSTVFAYPKSEHFVYYFVFDDGYYGHVFPPNIVAECRGVE
jgi:hypothetical protein